MENNFKFNLNNFDGPLDLLLSLIKNKKADLLTIDISDLALQYLEIIKNLNDNDIDIASEYLVMAATLMNIKAKMLLEDPEIEEEIIQDKEMILKQLIEYKQFKEIAKILKGREESRREILMKNISDYDQYYKENDSSLLDGHATYMSIMNILKKMFERLHAEKLKKTLIDAVDINPEQRVAEIEQLFREKDNITFEEIFSVPSLAHFVITFIALLDMARREIIKLIQDEEFGEIKIIKIKKSIGEQNE